MGNCKCNETCPPGYRHITEHIEYDRCIPNHIFDPNPPAYNGAGYHFHETCTNRVSMCQPGIGTGLYGPCGPLNISNASCTASILTAVETKTNIVLTLTFKYTNSSLNNSVDLQAGKIYTVVYIENGTLRKCSGKITNIYKVNSLEEVNIYKIKIDCSSNYSNSVVIIKSDQIRDIKEYHQYAEEDSTIGKSLHRNGTTTAAVLKDVLIENATLDENNNILSGTIISGTIDNGTTINGVAEGYNSNNHKIFVINGTTEKGIIQNGSIISGFVRSGDIDGKKDDKTGIVEQATVKGIITNAIIMNSEVLGGKTYNGTVIDPIIKNSVLKDAEVTGTDMITTGGTTIGNITTGGTTVGGSANGGIAYGMIEGHQFTIEDGITTGKLTTTGGSVVGGQIIGGTQIGNAIINAMIVGGTAIGGTTIGGNTSGGQLIPSKNAVSPVQKPHSSVINCEEQNKKIQEELNSHINKSNTDPDSISMKIPI